MSEQSRPEIIIPKNLTPEQQKTFDLDTFALDLFDEFQSTLWNKCIHLSLEDTVKVYQTIQNELCVKIDLYKKFVITQNCQKNDE